MAIIGTTLAVAVVLIDSSRNVEAAVLVASAVVVVANRLRLTAHTLRIAGAMAVAGAIAAMTVLVMSPALMARMANVAKITARFALWNDAGSVWLAHPFAGIGPGAFPFGYMLSDHFRLSLFDPRHPDNAVVQLLVEAGVIGVVAAAVCMVTLIRGARRRYRAEPRATWAILVCAIATLGANPTDFLFLMAPTLVWAAILVPAADTDSSPKIARRTPSPPFGLQVVRTSVLSVVALAVTLTSAAGISYEIARDAYLRGDDIRADSALGISETLDPSLAIYGRERASLAFARGDFSRAVAGYRQSLQISPVDPVAWRGLALALLQNSQIQEAAAAADHAVDLMFLSPANQLVRAATAEADPVAFNGAMRVALRSAPWLAVVSWHDTVVAFADRALALRNAVDPAPSDASGDPFFGEELLAIIDDRPDVAIEMAKKVAPSLRRSAAALSALAECDIGRSSSLLDDAARTEIEAGGFWIVRPIVLAALGTGGLERDRTTALSLRFWGLSAGPGPSAVPALAGNISDAWRYRRNSLGVAAANAAFPSATAGLWTLMTDPAGAVGQFGTAWPPECTPGR